MLPCRCGWDHAGVYACVAVASALLMCLVPAPPSTPTPHNQDALATRAARAQLARPWWSKSSDTVRLLL